MNFRIFQASEASWYWPCWTSWLRPRGPGSGFTILGDPAQAIYGFAAYEEGREYPSPADYWERVVRKYGAELEQCSLKRNYRASEPLAELSARLRSILLSERSESEKLQFVRAVLATLPPPPEPAGRALATGRKLGKPCGPDTYERRGSASAASTPGHGSGRSCHASPTARRELRNPSAGLDCGAASPLPVSRA